MSRGPDQSKLKLWRSRLQEFERGSASVVEFCRRMGVSKASFYLWRRKVALAGPEDAPAVKAAAALSFLPVQITSGSASQVKVLLPNGTRVLVPGSDREALRAVIEIAARVEARSC
jgi:transposase-like protein